MMLPVGSVQWSLKEENLTASTLVIVRSSIKTDKRAEAQTIKVTVIIRLQQLQNFLEILC